MTTIKKNQRKYQDGMNVLENGYEIEVLRYTSPYDYSSRRGNPARKSGKYFGFIHCPNGDIISMESGYTTNAIAKAIANHSHGESVEPTRTYNRGGESSSLITLEKIRQGMIELGMPTDEVDAKILAERERIANESSRANNEKEIKKLRKEIAKLTKLSEQLMALNLTEANANVQEKINALETDITALMDC